MHIGLIYISHTARTPAFARADPLEHDGKETKNKKAQPQHNVSKLPDPHVAAV